MQALRILHLANHDSTNVGNGALISGVERTIHEDFSNPVEFVAEAWDDYTIPGAAKRFDREFVSLCRGMNCLLVGAAVTMVGSRAHAQTGMRFDLPLEMWSEIECPIIFYGLSYRTWPDQPYHHADKLGAAIEYAVKSDRCLFSVRNDGTRDWLSRRLDIDVSGVHVVPDPALFVAADPSAMSASLSSDRINIAVSLNDEDPRNRFRDPAPSLRDRLTAQWHPSREVRRKLRTSRRRDALLSDLANVLDRIAEDDRVQIILCPHHHEDFRLIADFFEICSSRLKHQIVTTKGLAKADRAADFYGFYANVDLTLAMRVHAMSPSIGLNTPTVALCSQDRMIDFMRDLDLEEVAIDVFAGDFRERLWQLCRRLLDDSSGARKNLEAVTATLRQRTREFNRRVEQILENHGAS